MTYFHSSGSVLNAEPERTELRSMKKAEAEQYLEANGFYEQERFQNGRLFAAAMGLSALLRTVFPEEKTERFLDAVFEEDTGLASRFVPDAYRILGEPVPKHLLALAAFPDIWSELICITAVLLEDGDDPDPSGPGKSARIMELLKETNHDTKKKKGTV